MSPGFKKQLDGRVAINDGTTGRIWDSPYFQGRGCVTRILAATEPIVEGWICRSTQSGKPIPSSVLYQRGGCS
jgi:hypothetical protein